MNSSGEKWDLIVGNLALKQVTAAHLLIWYLCGFCSSFNLICLFRYKLQFWASWLLL